MQARMNNPAVAAPETMKALMALSKSAHGRGLPERTALLVHLRVSQINGCSVCLEMHGRELRERGESDARLFTVAGWRDAPFFDDAERAALALAEAVTRIADSADPVPDEVWDEAARHYDEQTLGALLVEIGAINIWNRLNVATRQVAGAWTAAAA